jgi:fatty-acyl-CoA synthase
MSESPNPASPMPNSPFPQPALDALREAPDAPLFERGQYFMTRGDFLATVGRIAAGLRAAGLGRTPSGQPRSVAIQAATSPEAYAAYLAAHALGCRVVIGSTAFARPQLARVLSDGVDAVVVDTDSVLPPAVEVPRLRLADLVAARPARGRLTVDVRADDVARVLYTSGSTGMPKGCAQTYRALSDHFLWQPAHWSPLITELARGSARYLLHGPLGWSVVLDWVALCLYGGGVAVLADEDPTALFPEAIARHRITGAALRVPDLYRMLDVLRERPVDTSSLRWLLVAGTSVAPRRLTEAVLALGPVVYHGYGSAECNGISVLTPRDFARVPGAHNSVGRPLAQVDVAIRDARDGVGEVYVRSPYVMSGYWGDSELTAGVLSDGWYRTGDLGFLDEHGLLHLVGRSRDIIVVGTWNCYARAIEAVLTSDPDVDQACVVGVPDERTGEAVHAFLVPAPGRTPDRARLARLVDAELGPASVPSAVTLVSEVPVSFGGEPDRQALRSRLAAARHSA